MVGTRVIPNFFIVGAPKCGTTALSEYLRYHPNIFISNPKEPYYFADDLFGKDLEKYVGISALEDYKKLFVHCTNDHLVVGEASVWYLYSKTAIQNIYRYNKGAKIIVMLRNPVDLLVSLHLQMLYNFQEDVSSFQKAWDLQEKRRRGTGVPKRCWVPTLLQYGDVGRLGEQVERLYSIFPEEQVKYILFDDFVKSTKQVYENVLSFLEIPTDGRTKFPPVNERKVHKSGSVGRFLQQPPYPLRYLWRKLTKVCGHELSKLIYLLREMNSTSIELEQLDARFRAKLVDEFRDDVKKLSKILDRDLDHWR